MKKLMTMLLSIDEDNKTQQNSDNEKGSADITAAIEAAIKLGGDDNFTKEENQNCDQIFSSKL